MEEINDFSELSENIKVVLNERLQEDENTYLSAKESIDQLKKEFGL